MYASNLQKRKLPFPFAGPLSKEVIKRFQIFLVLFAWFMATGAQWDLVQTFGWGQMFVGYSRSMPLLEAVKKTFDGEMCSVCKAVNEAKQQGNKTTVPCGKFDGKMILVFQPVPTVFQTVPDSDSWSHSDREPLSAQRSAPPTPPPRIA